MLSCRRVDETVGAGDTLTGEAMQDSVQYEDRALSHISTDNQTEVLAKVRSKWVWKPRTLPANKKGAPYFGEAAIHSFSKKNYWWVKFLVSTLN